MRLFSKKTKNKALPAVETQGLRMEYDSDNDLWQFQPRLLSITFGPARLRSALRQGSLAMQATRFLAACAVTVVLCGFGVGIEAAENDSSVHVDGDVLRREIRTNVFADFYIPSRTERVPGIILLGGSDGEPMKERAALLASHGYAVLNLFYFGQVTLPKEFVKVPVEYLTNAVSWLQAQEHVDSARIGVIGHSRGTEAAFLTAILRPDVRAVVAVAPSCVIWPGPGASGYFHSAWSLNGKEMPYVPVSFSKGVGAFLKEVTGGTQIEHRPLFEEALKNKSAVQRAMIAVEKIHGAVLLISGTDDRVWPSALMAERIVARLREHGHAFTYRHLSYENAGHSFGLPGQPRTDDATETFKMGGTVAGNAAAASNSWRATLEFLETELRSRHENPANQ